MGAKENIEYIKKELDKEEKFLESLLKAERFYKKYKKPILGALGALALGILGYIAYDYKVQYDLEVSNKAYLKLLQNPNDKEALETLKSKNERLYTLYLYQQGVKNKDLNLLLKVKNSDLPILPDLATYHIAVIKGDEKEVYSYATLPNAVLKELAMLEDSYLLMKQEQIKTARDRIATIPENSPAQPLGLLLRHYGSKVKE
ncbi:MAG: hypothetical protein GXO61_00475 [Epsilonproteobacteria bacterium]|nr:hypothetical protein [Campylobacterota bacterium]